MSSTLLGRTNEAFPAKWLSLAVPDRHAAEASELARAALAANTVIDISAGPGFWGGHLRGTEATLMTIGPPGLTRSVGEQGAHDLLHAHLLETLCAIGREHVDFYFLLITEPLQESQINGALIALEEARHEGNIRFFGLAAEDPMAAQSVLHFHDAFECVLLPNRSTTQPLRLLSQSRRIAVIQKADDASCEPNQGETTLFKVSSAEQILAVTRAKAAAR